ncbi:MAG: RagB/SusD family nutrient uptake outer membrane protein [Gemmatimonadaceae bacterium]
MTKPRLRNSFRTAGLGTLLLVPAGLALLQGCTELDETPTSAITPEQFYKNEQEIIGGLAAVYAQLRNIFPGTAGSYWYVSQVSTDETIVPTRGGDWADNNRWLQLHRQTWEANSSAGLDDLNNAWVQAFTGVARANVVLGVLPGVQVADKNVVEAELRTLRAFYYYELMDLFGGVPIVTTSEILPRPRNTRAEVFQFIETELLAARKELPLATQVSSASHGRITRGAADAILANMYLNAQVFTGEVTTAGLQPGPARWQDAVNFADSILNSGQYTLEAAFAANFRGDNHLSRENIFVVKHLAQDGLGLRLVNAALHYNQFSPSPWNGFSTLAETYNAFDSDDKRRDATFLAGPQVHVETGVPVTDRQNRPLVFTPTIANATQAAEGEGARIYKWPVDPKHLGPDHGNDFAFFRLGEIYLIKAEALFELGNTGGALVLLNALRARAFNPPELLSSVSRDVILRERLFELAVEGKRRQDLIRHGKFTNVWSTTMIGGKEQREPYRILMPIPQTQLDANPLLTQNAGY